MLITGIDVMSILPTNAVAIAAAFVTLWHLTIYVS